MKLSIVILTFALATVCNGGVCSNMASEYLISKWKTWFQITDSNHDGIVSLADKEKTSSTFPKLHNFDVDETKEVQAKFDKWWTDFIFEIDTDNMTESQYVNGLNVKFSSNEHTFHNWIARYVTIICRDIYDTNKDGSISEQEFIFAYQNSGQGDVALIKKLFQSYKQDPIPLSTLIESWVNFITEDDESKDSIETG